MELEGIKADLHRYLQVGREALVWKLEGLSEYEIRRPMTPTGTNLLGIVKHVASVEAGYLGEIMGRRFDEDLPWFDEDADPNADMWATADESREYIVGLYRRVWANSDATIEAADLETIGVVPWWPEGRNHVTLHTLLIHMIAETHRHAGQADIVRETIDGAAGLRDDNSNLPEGDAAWWADYHDRVEAAAREAEGVIGAYLATLPQPQRDTLTALRATLRELLPGAEESISYKMPCFKVDGKAVAGFDGFKAHCSYFPHSGNIVQNVSGVPAWCNVSSKGTLKFPIDRPLPKTLVRKLVRARLDEIATRGR